MAINFPESPTVGSTHTVGGRQFTFQPGGYWSPYYLNSAAPTGPYFPVVLNREVNQSLTALPRPVAATTLEYVS